MTSTRRDALDWVASVGVAALLGVDVRVHAHLASQRWTGWHPLTPAQLFGIEAVLAAAAALAVLLSGRRSVWIAAALVGAGGLVAVVVTRYIDIPSLGPIPSMYEPIWYGEKTWSALAEGLAALVAAGQLLRLGHRAPEPVADRPAVTVRS